MSHVAHSVQNSLFQGLESVSWAVISLCTGWNCTFNLMFPVFWRQVRPTWLYNLFHSNLFRRWIYMVSVLQSGHEYSEMQRLLENVDLSPIHKPSHADKARLDKSNQTLKRSRGSHRWLGLLTAVSQQMTFWNSSLIPDFIRLWLVRCSTMSERLESISNYQIKSVKKKSSQCLSLFFYQVM